MAFQFTDEGIETDLPKIRSRDQINLLEMVCPLCVYGQKLGNVNGVNKTVFDQEDRDFVTLSKPFETKVTETTNGKMFKIEVYKPVRAVITLTEHGMLPVSSKKEYQLSNHDDEKEMLDNVFRSEVGIWNSIKGLRKHFRRSHSQYRVIMMSDDPLQRAFKEAARKVMQTYLWESISQTPQEKRPIINRVYSCYKALKVR